MEERRGAWSDPRTVLQLCTVLIGAFVAFMTFMGAIIGTYVFVKTSATTSEISNAGLSDKITKMDAQMNAQLAQINAKLDANGNKVTDVEKDNTRQDGEIKQLETRIASAEENIKIGVSATNGLRDRVSRIEGNK